MNAIRPLHTDTYKRIMHPQYTLSHPNFSQLDWLHQQSIENLGKLKSAAEAIAKACDEHVAEVASKAPNARADADAFLDVAFEPLDAVVLDLIKERFL